MNIRGGRAGFTSVSFVSDKYQSVTRLKKGQYFTEITPNKKDSKIIKLLSKVPIIRAYSMMIGVMLAYWMRFVIPVVFLHVFSFFYMDTYALDEGVLVRLPANGLQIFSWTLIIAGIVIKLSPVGKLHAAEHQAATAFQKDLELTIRNIRMQSRVHENCGTNLIMSFFLCYVLLFWIFGNAIWVYFVAWAVGFEIWKNEPKVIWKLILVIGGAIQYTLFTSKPNEKHLIAAREALIKLQDKELEMTDRSKICVRVRKK